jgi:CubicO group peptidase (beta-lactamase class C family)
MAKLSSYCIDLINQCTHLPEGLGQTFGLIVYRDGEVLAEQYQGALPGSGRAVNADVALLSWSMAKSVTQTLLGLAHDDGLINVDGPAPMPTWSGDDRRAITIRHLLQMSSGLRWNEEYTTADGSHVIDMLFGDGKADMADFAAQQPLMAPPGTVHNYSSGTTNILCAILDRSLREKASTTLVGYLNDRLLAPMGVTFNPSEDVTLDGSGLWIGSSFLYLRLQDWLRYGLLYLNQGMVDGRRVVHERWITEAQTPALCSTNDEYGYSNHWWLWPTRSATPDAFAALGYEGQHVIVVPSKRAVVVRLGSTPDASKHVVRSLLHRVIEAI